MLRVYGHQELVALEEVDELYASGRVVPISAARAAAAS
jgi:hypothetical protein